MVARHTSEAAFKTHSAVNPLLDIRGVELKYSSQLMNNASVCCRSRRHSGIASVPPMRVGAASLLAAVLLAYIELQGAQSTDRTSKAGLNYRIEGTGPAVVLVHCFHMDLREWDEVAESLVKARTVIRYDVRGHGRSGAGTANVSAAEDIRGLLDELGVQRATVAGVSMGAGIAADFAMSWPNRVERLVLLAPSIDGVEVKTDASWMRPIGEAVRAGDLSRAAELWWDGPLFAQARLRPEAVTRYRQVIASNSSIWRYAVRPPALSPPAGARLASLPMPVVAIAGALDTSGAVAVANTVGRAAPRAEVRVWEGAGHMLSIERPSAVAAVVLATSPQ